MCYIVCVSLELGVEGPGATRPLLDALVLFIAAVVLLDEDGRPPRLLELLLLVITAELTLNQYGRLRHLLIQGVLEEDKHTHINI